MTSVRVVPFAHALALVSAGAYLLCLLFAAVAPDLFAAILESWFHGTLTGMRGGVRVTVGGMLLGLLSVAVCAWLFGLALASVYNRLGRGRAGSEATE